MGEIRIRRPDNAHGHLRIAQMLLAVIFFACSVFRRYVVMGNTFPRPIETAEDVIKYRDEILCNSSKGFEPIMSIMLTKNTTPEMVRAAYEAGARYLKLIPEGTSTNSEDGVSLVNLKEKYPAIREVEEICLDPNKEDIVFSLHPELIVDQNGKKIPYLFREEASLPFCRQLVNDFPGLKIIFEHLSTETMINFVKSCKKNVGATLMPMHAVIEYQEVCNSNGEVIEPCKFFKPVAKRWNDVIAVRLAMISGDPRFFFGTDSAPHPREKKYSHLLDGEKPSAGIFSDPTAIPVLADIFFSEISDEKEARLKLENFTSRYWAEFMGLPLNDDEIVIKKEDWVVSEEINEVPVFMGGKTLHYKVL